MKYFIPILGMFMLFAFTSCNTVRVSTDYDRAANFSEYKTFAFHENGLKSLKMNDLDKRRVVGAITQTLQSKGMTAAQSESAADLIVNISAKNKTRVEVSPAYDPWWGWGPYWGGNQRVNSYKEGALILDLIDRRQNILVWQGIGQGLNVSDIESKADKIPVAVEEIFKNYPPKK